MKIIVKVIKKVVFALSIIYSFNLIMNPVKMFIPINIFTVAVTSFLGFPGLLLLLGLSTII